MNYIIDAKSMITTKAELIFVVWTCSVKVKAWFNAEQNDMTLLYVGLEENKSQWL
jgi:hypothetical protein